jgi:hypothetical protein
MSWAQDDCYDNQYYWNLRLSPCLLLYCLVQDMGISSAKHSVFSVNPLNHSGTLLSYTMPAGCIRLKNFCFLMFFNYAVSIEALIGWLMNVELLMEWELAEKTCPSDISFTTNPTWSLLGSNPNCRGFLWFLQQIVAISLNRINRFVSVLIKARYVFC